MDRCQHKRHPIAKCSSMFGVYQERACLAKKRARYTKQGSSENEVGRSATRDVERRRRHKRKLAGSAAQQMRKSAGRAGGEGSDHRNNHDDVSCVTRVKCIN